MAGKAIFSHPKEVPVLEAIEVAALKGELVFFIGNGVSRLYSLKSWEGLADRMLDMLAEKAVLSHSQVELIKQRPVKTKISIADFHFKKLRTEGKFNDLTYANALGLGDFNYPKAKAYQVLAKCGAKFITTNYDTILFKAYEGSFAAEPVKETATPDGLGESVEIKREEKKNVKIVVRPELFSWSDFTANNVIWHLHGCVDDEGGIVASTKSYLDLYANEEIQKKLRWIFSDHVVVFVGYGLEELELLDQIVRASRNTEKGRPRGAYLLLPIFSHEAEIFDALSNYYEEMGITVIPFSKDADGYASLEILLENWSGKISAVIGETMQTKKLDIMRNLRKEVEEGV